MIHPVKIAFPIALWTLWIFLSLNTFGGAIEGIVPIRKSQTSKIPVEKYRGKISGKVAPSPSLVAGVWLEGPQLSAPAAPAPVTLAQTNYQFAHSLLVIPIGTTIAFPNNDPDYHNVYSLSRAESFDLGRYKKNETPAPKVRFEKAGFIALRCEIHKHMNATLIVVDSPHYAVTDANGRFRLKNIPPGTYTLHAQLDRKTRWKTTVRVNAKKTAQVTFPTP